MRPIDPDLITLINSGATTLLGLMVTDSWAKAKAAAGKIIGRGDAGAAKLAERELEEAREEIQVAQPDLKPEMEQQVQDEIRLRLTRAVKNDEGAAESLRLFVRDFAGDAQRSSSAPTLNISATANDRSRVYQQGSGSQYNK